MWRSIPRPQAQLETIRHNIVSKRYILGIPYSRKWAKVIALHNELHTLGYAAQDYFTRDRRS